MLNIAKIKAISLDLDDTLWPIAPVIARAEDVMHDWLKANAPSTALVFADRTQRQRIRAQTELEWAHVAHDLSLLRRESIRLALQQGGDDPALAEPAFEVFFAARMQVQLYDEAHQALQQLSERYPLVALSNGNADVHRVGIGHFFSASLSARELGAAKPDARAFHAASRALGLASENILHVGDDIHMDVLGALDAGMQAAWVNRVGYTWAHAQEPHATVADLGELCTLLGLPDTAQ